MVFGQVPDAESFRKTTLGAGSQLSVTTRECGSGGGTSASHCTVTGPGQLMAGAVVSRTTMVAVQELDAPPLSTTVRVTRFVPNRYGPGGVRLRLTIEPSGSNEPLSTAVISTDATQLAPALTVSDWQKAVGGVFVPTLVV